MANGNAARTAGNVTSNGLLQPNMDTRHKELQVYVEQNYRQIKTRPLEL